VSEDETLIQVYLDLRRNFPRNDASREVFRAQMRTRFETSLPGAVERIWDLPTIIVQPEGEYLALLVEARELFVAGHHYSCVAMCGIVAERLVKDVLRASIRIANNGAATPPPQLAFDQLEHVEVSALVRFLHEARLLDSEAFKAARKLAELRNDYAHARGKNQQADALKAITLLHKLVEATVSVLKHHEIRDGRLVPKTQTPGQGA
jgi:hypothetical protein